MSLRQFQREASAEQQKKHAAARARVQSFALCFTDWADANKIDTVLPGSFLAQLAEHLGLRPTAAFRLAERIVSAPNAPLNVKEAAAAIVTSDVELARIAEEAYWRDLMARSELVLARRRDLHARDLLCLGHEHRFGLGVPQRGLAWVDHWTGARSLSR